MIGALAGDIIGSVYEHHSIKTIDFPLWDSRCRFTDDSVLTVATADAILTGTPFGEAYWSWGRRYPDAGYGGTFRQWLREPSRPEYGSYGNGSAMRVSPVGWAFHDPAQVLETAQQTALPTHGHPEGIRGAQAVALAVYLARSGAGKAEIRDQVTALGYDLTRSIDEIRPAYQFDVRCQGSVPQAITAFLDSESVEHAIRLAISLGGDADTQAAIAGAIAEAHYGGVLAELRARVLEHLPDEMVRVLEEFTRRFVEG